MIHVKEPKSNDFKKVKQINCSQVINKPNSGRSFVSISNDEEAKIINVDMMNEFQISKVICEAE